MFFSNRYSIFPSKLSLIAILAAFAGCGNVHNSNSEKNIKSAAIRECMKNGVVKEVQIRRVNCSENEINCSGNKFNKKIQIEVIVRHEGARENVFISDQISDETQKKRYKPGEIIQVCFTELEVTPYIKKQRQYCFSFFHL